MRLHIRQGINMPIDRPAARSTRPGNEFRFITRSSARRFSRFFFFAKIPAVSWSNDAARSYMNQAAMVHADLNSAYPMPQCGKGLALDTATKGCK
jgi:hypothetical protein